MRYVLFLLILLVLPAVCFGQEPIGDGIDCTEISIDFVDDPNLTREERIVQMEKAFYESLEKYERCKEAKAKARSSANSSAGGEGSGAEMETGDLNDGIQGTKKAESDMNDSAPDAVQSLASPGISGTQPHPADPDEGSSGGDSGAIQRGEESDSQNGGMNTDSDGVVIESSGTGKIPDDIPPAANDDALATQIRYAAENETDPQKKEQLWNEYRKYKGLPQK